MLAQKVTPKRAPRACVAGQPIPGVWTNTRDIENHLSEPTLVPQQARMRQRMEQWYELMKRAMPEPTNVDVEAAWVYWGNRTPGLFPYQVSAKLHELECKNGTVSQVHDYAATFEVKANDLWQAQPDSTQLHVGAQATWEHPVKIGETSQGYPMF